MGEVSAISWTDATFNPWIGCAKVSPACDGCYAEALMGVGGRMGRAEWGAPGKGEGTRVRTAEANWKKPLSWNRKAEKDGTRPFVFCASLADVFDNAVPPEWHRDLFDLIRATPHLTWLLLTKRPGNIVKLFEEACRLRDDGTRQTSSLGDLRLLWPRNAAIGCTVVNQQEADRDVPKLLGAKAALNPAFAFLSMEPLLGPVDLTALRPDRHEATTWDALTDTWSVHREPWFGAGLDWVITGGETDQGAHKARPADPDWFRSLRDQCAAAGVPFHFKQWGEWQPAIPLAADEHADQLVYYAFTSEGPPRWLRRIGKDLDPCTLDGVRHLARPEVRA